MDFANELAAAIEAPLRYANSRAEQRRRLLDSLTPAQMAAFRSKLRRQNALAKQRQQQRRAALPPNELAATIHRHVAGRGGEHPISRVATALNVPIAVARAAVEAGVADGRLRVAKRTGRGELGGRPAEYVSAATAALGGPSPQTPSRLQRLRTLLRQYALRGRDEYLPLLQSHHARFWERWRGLLPQTRRSHNAYESEAIAQALGEGAGLPGVLADFLQDADDPRHEIVRKSIARGRRGPEPLGTPHVAESEVPLPDGSRLSVKAFRSANPHVTWVVPEAAATHRFRFGGRFTPAELHEWAGALPDDARDTVQGFVDRHYPAEHRLRKYAAYRAPKGGVTVRGVYYDGGSLIPDLQKFAAGEGPTKRQAVIAKLRQRLKLRKMQRSDRPVRYSSHAAFNRAIFDDPKQRDRLPSLVYADWLDENGQPTHAEVIRRHQAAAEHADSSWHGPERRVIDNSAFSLHVFRHNDERALERTPPGVTSMDEWRDGNESHTLAVGHTIPDPESPDHFVYVYHKLTKLPPEEVHRLVSGLQVEGVHGATRAKKVLERRYPHLSEAAAT